VIHHEQDVLEEQHFAHIPFVVNHAFSATPMERLQQHPLLVQRTAPMATYWCCDQNVKVVPGVDFTKRAWSRTFPTHSLSHEKPWEDGGTGDWIFLL